MDRLAYSVHGLRVESARLLPQLPPTDSSGPADVTITIGPVDRPAVNTDGDGFVVRVHQRGPLPVHASATRLGDLAVAFCADSGGAPAARARLQRLYVLSHGEETAVRIEPLDRWRAFLELRRSIDRPALIRSLMRESEFLHKAETILSEVDVFRLSRPRGPNAAGGGSRAAGSSSR